MRFLVLVCVLALAVLAVRAEQLTLEAPPSGTIVFQGGLREAEYVEDLLNVDDNITVDEMWETLCPDAVEIKAIYPAMDRIEFTSYGYNSQFGRARWFLTEADGSWVEVSGRSLVQYLTTFSKLGAATFQQTTGLEFFYPFTRASDPWVQHPRRPQWALDSPELVNELARDLLVEGYGPIRPVGNGHASYGRDWTWAVEAFARYGPHAPLSNGILASTVDGAHSEWGMEAYLQSRNWTLSHGFDIMIPGFLIGAPVPELVTFQVRWYRKGNQLMETNKPTALACALAPAFCTGSGIPGVSRRTVENNNDAGRVAAAHNIENDSSAPAAVKEAAHRFLALSEAERNAAVEAAIAAH